MHRIHLTAVILAAALPLMGCQPHRSSASSADSHAPGTTTATLPANCSKYPPGAAGVIRTFCDGTAVVRLTVAGAPHTLNGGTCSVVGGQFALNLGVVAGPELAGPKPDYIGLAAQTPSGAFTNAVLAINLDGKSYVMLQNSGTVATTGGGFSGKSVSGDEVSGTFTC